MATAKKAPSSESKPKAAQSKALVKPDAIAKAKAAAPKKDSQEIKPPVAKTASATPKPKPSVKKDGQAASAAKGTRPKKSVAEDSAEKPEQIQKVASEPAVSATPPALAAPTLPSSPEANARKGPAEKPPASASAAVAPMLAPQTPAETAKHVDTVLQAVKEGRAIELIFRDAETDPPRTFEPRQLIFDTLTQAWFVWGWDRRYNAERHHRVDQMAEINLVDGPGRSAQGPYKEGTPPNLIGGWLGGEPIRVKAVLQKQWIFAVKQAPPAFPEFKIEDGEDGKATVSFVATDLRAIARWCLQFGEGIQVLEPQRLVDRVKQVGVAWVGKPAAAAPAPPPRPAPQPAPRPEYKPEHKQEHKSEHRRDHGKDRDEAPKKRPGVEIRIEKL